MKMRGCQLQPWNLSSIGTSLRIKDLALRKAKPPFELSNQHFCLQPLNNDVNDRERWSASKSIMWRCCLNWVNVRQTFDFYHQSVTLCLLTDFYKQDVICVFHCFFKFEEKLKCKKRLWQLRDHSALLQKHNLQLLPQRIHTNSLKLKKLLIQFFLSFIFFKMGIYVHCFILVYFN